MSEFGDINREYERVFGVTKRPNLYDENDAEYLALRQEILGTSKLPVDNEHLPFEEVLPDIAFPQELNKEPSLYDLWDETTLFATKRSSKSKAKVKTRKNEPIRASFRDADSHVALQGLLSQLSPMDILLGILNTLGKK